MATEAPRAVAPLDRLRAAVPEGAGVESWILAGAVCLYCWLLAPATSDLAAAVFRSDLFEQHTLLLYNAQWYDGHHLVAYSVLSPPLGALLGTRFAGALCTLGAVIAFERTVVPRYGSAGRAAAVLFALTLGSSLLIGRIAFAVGFFFGALAVYFASRDRRVLACLAAVGAALGSPLAGLFLAMLAGAWLLVSRRPWALVLAGCAVVPSLILQFAFQEGGTFPYGWVSFGQLLVCVALFALALPLSERLLWVGVGLYLVLGIYAQAVPSQLGGNVNRLGTIVGAPLITLVLWNRRRLLLLFALPYLLWWPFHSVIRDLPNAGGAIAEAAYYQPLNDWLARNTTGPIRVEIPPTRNHWEGVYVGEHFMLARGWERQLDQRYDALYYGTIITPANYRRWLRRNAVQYVALAGAPTDFAGRSEADFLVQQKLPYLRPVWGNRDWRLWAVIDPTPLLSGPGRLLSSTADSFTFQADRPGRFVMRLHFSPYWALSSGAGCVQAARLNWTGITVKRPGRVTVRTRFSPVRVLSQGPRCS
ncbi:MAG: hypothetical protein QOD53_1043 [Thermoleophilaceae bacterium]|jgi:hypothetical protein|nr:hypothetical protein [Thermoleophilaceae bacterium]